MNKNIVELIKVLRAETQAGFGDCKNAAIESNGDYEKAVAILKSKGIAKAAKKANNITENGSVVVKSNGNKIVILNFRSETDFASNGDAFCDFVSKEAEIFLNSDVNSIEETMENGISFKDRFSFFASTLGENVVLNQQVLLENSETQKYICYLHKKINSKYEDIAHLVVAVKVNKDANEDVCKKIAAHIAASDPIVLSASYVTEELRKENEDIDNFVLLNQEYFYEPSLKISEFLSKNDIMISEFKVYKA